MVISPPVLKEIFCSMPELPEVQTLVTSLEILVGKTLDRIVPHRHNLRHTLDIKQLTSLKSQKIIKISRRAKYMIWSLQSGQSLIFHLGMSGTFRLRKDLMKHDHIAFYFDKDCYAYHDPRRFGMVWITECAEKFLQDKNLGIEPLSPDFNKNTLFQITQKRTQTIKGLLFCQQHVVGLGNIYINEALFMSAILPHRPSNSLSIEECGRLVKAIVKSLELAIEHGGSTLVDFHDVHGSSGWFQNWHLVYNKKQCSTCHGPICREVILQRSTFYCPQCQQ